MIATIKTKQLVPELRFKEFEDGWSISKLIKHVNSISSGKVKPMENGEFLVYGSTGVIGRSDYYTHDGDYILIARVGANAGKINRVKGKYAVTDNTLIIDLKSNVNVSFCELFLTKYNLNKLIFGSGQPLITGGLLKSIDYIFPSLPEQQKIASFLSAVDEKIQQLTKKKELLEQYKKGVMQQLFSGELRFRDENGKDYPEWEEKRLGKMTSLLKDGSHSTHKDALGSDYYLLSAKNIKNGRIFIDESDRRISEEEYNGIYKNYCLKENDILLTIVGTIGRIAKFGKETNIAFQRSVAFFRFENDNPNYLLQFMFGVSFQKELDKRKVVSAQPGVYLGDLAKISIPRPCLEEQQKIATYLSSIDTKIEAVNNQITQTQEFKKGLLQKMFV